MLSWNLEPKLKCSKNRIFVTSHFGTLYKSALHWAVCVDLLMNEKALLLSDFTTAASAEKIQRKVKSLFKFQFLDNSRDTSTIHEDILILRPFHDFV